MIEIICALITAGGVFGAAVFAYKSAVKTIQANKEAEERRRQEELDIKKAEDLNRIIFPALQSLDINTICKEAPGIYNQNWLYALITDRASETLQQTLKVLQPKLKDTDFDISTIIDALYEVVMHENDLYEFMLRYNNGTPRKVDINLTKLNEDLAFINTILGKNYKLFDIKNKRPEK